MGYEVCGTSGILVGRRGGEIENAKFFEVFTTVLLNSRVVLDVMPCRITKPHGVKSTKL
jgi:hypothetical protein